MGGEKASLNASIRADLPQLFSPNNCIEPFLKEALCPTIKNSKLSDAYFEIYISTFIIALPLVFKFPRGKIYIFYYMNR
jgi:hypothetical protein